MLLRSGVLKEHVTKSMLSIPPKVTVVQQSSACQCMFIPQGGAIAAGVCSDVQAATHTCTFLSITARKIQVELVGKQLKLLTRDKSMKLRRENVM